MPQEKVSRVKLIAFFAGVNRHCCWFTAWFDVLVLTEKAVYEEDGTQFLLPSLQETCSPGTKLSTWMKVHICNNKHSNRE